MAAAFVNRHEIPLKQIFTGGKHRAISDEMLPVLIESVRQHGQQQPLDVFQAPKHPCNDSWKTSTVVAIAQAMWEDFGWDRGPLLADALQDADCNDEVLLFELQRGLPTPKVRAFIATLSGIQLYELINGHHRYAAFQKLSFESAQCAVYTLESGS